MLGVKIIDILGELLLAAVPLAILVGFIISFVRYKKCPPEKTQERKQYKLAAKFYGTVFGVMFLSAAVLIIFLVAVVAYM